MRISCNSDDRSLTVAVRKSPLLPAKRIGERVGCHLISRISCNSDDRSLTVAAQTGSALLMVLWLSAALSAIAFTVANTVRAETERTSTSIDSLRAYYLATGAIDRALLYINWGAGFRKPDGTPKYFENPMPVLRFEFPSGTATAEIIPETAKLNVNRAPPRVPGNLLVALAVP